jgi:DNA-binding GntR family transcriptional regulator
MLAAAEAILSGVTPTVEAVQEAAGISRGGSNNAMSNLETLGLLQRSRGSRGPASARRVIDTSAFLDQYARAAALLRRKMSVIRFHRIWRDPLNAFAAEIAPALEVNAEA